MRYVRLVVFSFCMCLLSGCYCTAFVTEVGVVYERPERFEEFYEDAEGNLWAEVQVSYYTRKFYPPLKISKFDEAVKFVRMTKHGGLETEEPSPTYVQLDYSQKDSVIPGRFYDNCNSIHKSNLKLAESDYEFKEIKIETGTFREEIIRIEIPPLVIWGTTRKKRRLASYPLLILTPVAIGVDAFVIVPGTLAYLFVENQLYG